MPMSGMDYVGLVHIMAGAKHRCEFAAQKELQSWMLDRMVHWLAITQVDFDRVWFIAACNTAEGALMPAIPDRMAGPVMASNPLTGMLAPPPAGALGPVYTEGNHTRMTYATYANLDTAGAARMRADASQVLPIPTPDPINTSPYPHRCDVCFGPLMNGICSHDPHHTEEAHFPRRQLNWQTATPEEIRQDIDAVTQQEVNAALRRQLDHVAHFVNRPVVLQDAPVIDGTTIEQMNSLVRHMVQDEQQSARRHPLPPPEDFDEIDDFDPDVPEPEDDAY
jgi:hypothetical protein